MTSKYRRAEIDLGDAALLRTSIARLARHLRAFDAASALTPSQSSLLSTVVRSGRVGLSELARLEGIDAPALSRAVGRLEEKGLVRRLQDPGDGRAVLVEATAAGRKLLERLRAARNDALRRQLERLDEDERAAVRAALPVLEALADALKEERGR
jgi:DNA-binding MarR family transcriptional regulator